MTAQRILFRTAIAALGSAIPATAGAAQNDLVIGATVVSPCAISVMPEQGRQLPDRKPVSVDCVSSTQSFVVLEDLTKASLRSGPQPQDGPADQRGLAQEGAIEIVKIVF